MNYLPALSGGLARFAGVTTADFGDLGGGAVELRPIPGTTSCGDWDDPWTGHKLKICCFAVGGFWCGTWICCSREDLDTGETGPVSCHQDFPGFWDGRLCGIFGRDI